MDFQTTRDGAMEEPPRQRNRRLAFYGGTDLSSEVAAFVKVLSELVVGSDRIALVTGGFSHVQNVPEGASVDRAAVEGATRALIARGLRVEDFVETWLPQPEMDRPDVARFREGHVKILVGRSAQARRFTVVQGVDGLVTFGGKKNTAMVLDMALASAVPPCHSLSPEATPSSPIYESFIRSLESSACVVADISDVNPNVMYELGHVHARGLRPFLFSRTGVPSGMALPFYLLPHRVGALDNLGAFLDQVRDQVRTASPRG